MQAYKVLNEMLMETVVGKWPELDPERVRK